MTSKTITIEITGDEQIILPALAAFCYQGGYTDTINSFENDALISIPNPISQSDFAKQRLSDFFRNEVANYNCNMAAKQALEAATAQTAGAMDLVTMNVEIT